MRNRSRVIFVGEVLAALVLCLPLGFAQEHSLTDFLSDKDGIDLSELPSDGYFDNSEFDVVDFQQPGTARPPAASRRPTRRAVPGQETATPTASDVGDYLASAPRMFGHYYGASGQLMDRSVGNAGVPQKPLIVDLPMGGGASPLQITDNNTPLPQSRSFFSFNHFENALRMQNGNQPVFLPVDQYTMGIERTFMDGISSWQLQLPITGGFDTPGSQGVSSGQIGNLGFISKTAIWRSDYAILSAGLGLELPTGASVQGRSLTSRYQVRNSSTTVLPFVGFMALPTDATFIQGFLTASVPANGNEFVVFPPGGGPARNAGIYNAQTRLHLDLAGGLWFYQNPGGGGITGMAFVGEVHYVAATQTGDFVNFTSFDQSSPTIVQIGNFANQQTVTNFTAGIHTVWNDRFQFRVAGAVPLAQRPNRGFDGEVIVQVNFIP